MCILPQLLAQGDQADHAGREVFFGMVYDVQGPQQGLLEGTHDYGAGFRIPLRQQLRQDGHAKSLGHGLDQGLGADALPGGLYVELVQGKNGLQAGAAGAARFPHEHGIGGQLFDG